MKLKLALLTVFAVAATGCQGPAKTESGTGSAPGAAPTASKPDQQQPAALTVPEELKTDAYRWFGLGNPNPMNIEVKSPEGLYTGTQTVRVKELKPNKVVYDLERSGTIGAKLGTETLALEKDGIYTIKSTEFEGDVHYLELPKHITPGKSWDSNGKYTQKDGTELIQKLNFKVVGQKIVKTPVGDQNSLYITSTGKMTSGKNRFRMESKFWYVKDKGLVKMEIKMHDLVNAKAAPKVINYQETK